MKATMIFIGLLSLFITLPINIYMSWLMYNHIHATDLMWFLWYLSWPLAVLLQVFSAIANVMNKKES